MLARCYWTDLYVPECACPSCSLALVRAHAPHLAEGNVVRLSDRRGVDPVPLVRPSAQTLTR